MFAILLSFFDKRLKERKVFLLILCLLSIIFLTMNYYYYSHFFISISGGDGKFDSNSNLGLTLLAIGRYFYLSLFPLNALPVSHYEGSIENVIGLFLLFLFIYLIIKKMKNKFLVLGFLAYFFIPLIPVTYKITKIFCSDTYLLNSSIGIYVSIYLIIKKFNFQKIHQ